MGKAVSPTVIVIVIVVLVVLAVALIWHFSGVSKKQGVLPGEMMQKHMPKDMPSPATKGGAVGPEKAETGETEPAEAPKAEPEAP